VIDRVWWWTPRPGRFTSVEELCYPL